MVKTTVKKGSKYTPRPEALRALNNLLSPSQYGFPSKFCSWRPEQALAILEIISDFSTGIEMVAASAPTGFGKSGLVMMVARALGYRAAIITPIKGHQDQYMRDFQSLGLVDVRGKSNYECPIEPGSNCENGPCMGGALRKRLKCPCLYQKALDDAAAAPAFVTNFSAWLYVNRYNKDGFGARPQLLVVDEAHDAPNKLSEFLKVSLSLELLHLMTVRNQIKPTPAAPEDDLMNPEWKSWLSDLGQAAHDIGAPMKTEAWQEMNRTKFKQAEKYLAMADSCALVAGSTQPWVIDRTRWSWTIEPVYPKEFTRRFLFLCSRTLLISATNSKKNTEDLLGVKPEEYRYREYRSDFPPERSPIYVRPSVTLKYPVQAAEWQIAVTLADMFISSRMDLKGIVHTVSFDRARSLKSMSDHGNRMRINDTRPDSGEGTLETVQRYKEWRAQTPGQYAPILVSPSLTTGWDFPDDDCRWQIIIKIPFPDLSSKISRARAKLDKEFGTYTAAIETAQAAGRAMRHSGDWCETLIIDNEAKWFLGFAPRWNGKGMKFLPDYFKQVLVQAEGIPERLVLD